MIRVVTSSQSAARDAAVIHGGVPSRALMQRAGAAAAAEIALRYRDRLTNGALVFVGPGNNGGDGWVVARALAAAGVAVRVIEPIAAKTPDAIAERTLALESLGTDCVTTGAVPADARRGESIVVDGLLGTGGRGTPAGLLADAVAAMNAARGRGAVVIALDIPTGVDATTGVAAESHVLADLTLTFGSIKRGQLVNRDACGTIVALDIGLGPWPESDDVPSLVDDAWVAGHLSAFPADAHKGTRKKLAIVGGAPGMAGASMLAARAALRSGVGMVKLVVAPDSVRVVQETEPYALAAPWPTTDDEMRSTIVDWADAVAIGPGLGRGDASRQLLELLLRCWRGPTLLDADAITLYEGKRDALAQLLGGRPALLTPHPLEFSRLSGVPANDVLAKRFDVAPDTAAELRATVLLKGVPTVVTSASGERIVTATGSPVLATAGSGDVLSGIAGTLLAQLGDPFVAGGIAGYVHGRAADRIQLASPGVVRGVALEDVVNELRDAWTFDPRPARYPVLAELPSLAGA